jgi:hypothetical protein
MKLKVLIYEDENGTLHFVDKGECLAYTPESSKPSVLSDYVSLNFGKYHLHVDKDDFEKFCRHFLTFSCTRKEQKHVPLLR